MTGWVQLFNGTDLTGWKTHLDQPGDWEVENGLLVGRGPRPSHLFSERGNFENFHLRVQAKINDGGDSGIFFRSDFAIKLIDKFGTRIPPGYEAQILENPTGTRKTGSLLGTGPWVEFPETLTRPNQWFLLEVVAIDNRIEIKVNGKTTVNFLDPKNTHKMGHFALQHGHPASKVQFRKIEIKELPANKTVIPPLAVAPFDATKAKEHQDAWAKHLGVDVETTNSIGMKLRLIPPGEFTMGSSAEEQQAAIVNLEQTHRRIDAGGKDGRLPYIEYLRPLIAAEGPAHRVKLKEAFYLAGTEVTQAQFETFVRATKYVTSAERDPKGGILWGRVKQEQSREFHWRTPARLPRGPNHPVTQVSYNDAVAFCQWLSTKEGITYVLPTEAQWEFACRAGTQTPWFSGTEPADLEKYAWGEFKVDPAIKEFEFHEVAKKAPNPFGLYDMIGNAQEWCRDWYSPTAYSVRAETDPTGPKTPDAEKNRLVRGGAIFLPHDLRSAIRRRAGVDYAENGVGFRVTVVGDLKPKPPGSKDEKKGTP